MVDYVNSKSAQCRSQTLEQRSQIALNMSDVPPDCPVQLEDKGLQRSTAPNPNDLLTCRHRTVNSTLSGAPPDCPVCHRQPTSRKWLETINTSQPPPFKLSKFSELHIHYKIKGKHSKGTIKAFNPL
jgi:hypothetical protein